MLLYLVYKSFKQLSNLYQHEGNSILCLTCYPFKNHLPVSRQTVGTFPTQLILKVQIETTITKDNNAQSTVSKALHDTNDLFFNISLFKKQQHTLMIIVLSLKNITIAYLCTIKKQLLA